MNAETTVLVTDKSVTTAINQLIEAEKRGLRKRRDTAISLNRFYRCESIKEEGMPFAELVSGDAWFDVLVHDKSSTGKQVLGYRKSIYDALKEMKHSNPSKVWADICAYGREELGLAPREKAEKPASEKLIKALENALNIASKHPSPSEAEINAVPALQKLIGSLGISIDSII